MRGNVIDRAVKALSFFESHRQFTIDDLAEELNVCRRTAYRYLTAFSRHFKIIQIKENRWADKTVRSDGWLPSLYRLQKD